MSISTRVKHALGWLIFAVVILGILAGVLATASGGNLRLMVMGLGSAVAVIALLTLAAWLVDARDPRS